MGAGSLYVCVWMYGWMYVCVCRGAMCGRCLSECTVRIEEGWGGVAGWVVAEDGRIGR